MLKETGTDSSTSAMDIMEQSTSLSEGSSLVGSPPELDSSMSLTSSCGGLGETDSDIVSDFSLQSSSNNDEISLVNKISQVRTILEVPEMISSTDGNGSKVTLYKVSIESNDICFHLPSSCVWRTYSEFVWLRKRLESGRSFIRRAMPDLPSRNLLNFFDKDFAEKRRIGLQEFLNKVMEDRSFLSDAAVHLFLQSNLSTDEIQAWLDRKVNDTVLELIQRGKYLMSDEYTPVQAI